MIYLLLIILAIIFVSNLYLNNKDFGAPAVMLSISFLFTALCGCAYQSMWGIDISFSTVVIVSFYVLLFSLVCLVTRYYYFHNRSNTIEQNCFDDILQVNSGAIIFTLMIFIGMTVLYVHILMNRTGSSTILETIGETYALSPKELNIPFYLRLYIAVAQGVGYWASYVFIRNLFYKKIEFDALLLFAICLLDNLLSGSRGVAVCLILSLPANILLQEYRNRKIDRKINIKKIIIVIIIGLLGLWVFANLERWLGRATISTWNATDTVGTYCGAELYNLDHFLRNSKIPLANQFGSLTLSSLLNTLSKYLDFHYVTPNAYGFLNVNGHFMGNVLTMLYEPLYDFGFVGCGMVIILYSFICQLFYNRATSVLSYKKIPFSILFYSYLFPLLAVSFFAWWFGNYVVSTTFIYILVSWKLSNVVFLQTRFKFAGKRLR